QQDRPRAAGGRLARRDGRGHAAHAWRPALRDERHEVGRRPGRYRQLHRTARAAAGLSRRRRDRRGPAQSAAAAFRARPRAGSLQYGPRPRRTTSMDAQFWLDRWREGRTNFHQARVAPPLQKYWPALGLAPGSLVLVPLAGKSLDMLWLARQGLRVLGVELSPRAVEQCFAENGLRPQVRDSAQGRHYAAGDIELICGDIFDLDDATLAACAGVYDRAALVALPADMRGRYVR